MRKLMIVLIAMAFIVGASFVHAEENGNGNEVDEGEYAFVSEVREVKDLLAKVLGELEKMNKVLAYGYPDETVMSMLVEIRDALQNSSSSAP